ncbi:MAG: glycosyl hydrolase family 18 protein [Ignavibacteriaceae bacterium]
MYSKIVIIVLFLNFLPSFTPAQKQEIVGYFSGGAAKNYKYNVRNIESSGSGGKLTVIDYAFCKPVRGSDRKIVPAFGNSVLDYQQIYPAEYSIDGVKDESVQAVRGNINQLKKLKARHPGLKILISIGGWGGCTYFSDAALTKESREFFVDSCINMYIKGNFPVVNGAGGYGAAAGIFDGIDIDWEFPISGGLPDMHTNPKDNDNLTELFKLFRKKLDEINPRLLLTAALPAQEFNTKNFNVHQDSKYLTWITLMTYDMYGGFDNNTVTGHHTNLFSPSDEPPIHPAQLSLDKTVKLFHDKYGVAYNKLLGGAAFYGRGWGEVDSVNNGLYRPGNSKVGGYDLYRYLVNLKNEGFKLYWDKSALANWLYNPEKKIFWSFDTPQSIALKTLYCKAHHMRGMMFWEISGDDDNGTLINSIYNMSMTGNPVDKLNSSKEQSSFSIIKPTEGDYYIEGSDVVINSIVNTPNSSIVKIEFFVDNKPIGFAVGGSFDWAWFNASRGEHMIKATAEDVWGGVSESVPIKIYVQSTDKCSRLWQSGKTYNVEEQVIYNGKIFVCTKMHRYSYGANSPGSGTEYWKPLQGVD